MDRNYFIVVSIKDFGSWLLDSANRRLVIRVTINCELSRGTEKFGVDFTEPVVEIAYVSEEFCIGDGGVVEFGSLGFGGMVFWVGNSEMFEIGVGDFCCSVPEIEDCLGNWTYMARRYCSMSVFGF